MIDENIVYEKSIEIDSETHLFSYLIEEMAELIIEEMVDVEIQFKIMKLYLSRFCKFEIKFSEIKQQELKRLNDRLDELVI